MPTETQRLKAELWRRFGSPDTPSEWDGNIYGGGKLSQRFWEYFKAIELLNLTADSVVLDIGGGSPVTGAGFFASLLATVVRKVIIYDPNISPSAVAPENVEFVRSSASLESFGKFLGERSDLTHAACISVFEHIAPADRENISQSLNDQFQGDTYVATFEFHARHTFFEHQLTAKTVSSLFSPLTHFYLDEMCASPVLAENAYDQGKIPKLSRKTPLTAANIPQWYPLAVRFLRMN